MNTQQFFSDVTNGLDHKPLRPWKPFFTSVPQDYLKAFEKYEGNFDRHIATSIPMYREMQLFLAKALVEIHTGGILVDIGGSEGSWAKVITEMSGHKILSDTLDCNKDMLDTFYLKPVKNADFTLGDFMDYNPHNNYNIVHAGMAFQFMPFSREECIKKVKQDYLTEHGLFLIEEKVVPDSARLWFQNEILKDEFKRMYYSEQDIARKKETVVNDMDRGLLRESELVKLLGKYFHYTYKYYEAGNFMGWACTNSFTNITKRMPKITF